MKSDKPKVLFDINDEPLCFAPLRALMETCDQVVVVVGYKADDVKSALLTRAQELFGAADTNKKISFALQDPPSGTGDAVRKAIDSLGKSLKADEDVLVVNGDLPLIRKQTLTLMLKVVRDSKLNSACLSMRMARPAGLGRILRDETGVFKGIREEKDAKPDEKAIREVNGGVYYFRAQLLAQTIKGLKSNNKQGEFYLTDLLGNGEDRAQRSEAILIKAPWDLMGVNSTFELAAARKVAQARLQRQLCEQQGVDFGDPDTAYISARAKFEGSCRVGPNTVIRGASRIGANVTIDGNTLIDGTSIADGAHVLWGCVLMDSKVGPRAHVGPMAHLRPGSELDGDVKVGNFVELKKTRLGKGAKVSHLSYLGDATVGAEANIGCGTITCNYDGYNKHQTQIGAGAFVGSDSQLVAPVTIGEGAYIASGTTVTKNVPAGALAIGRTPLQVKEGYADKLKARYKAQQKAKKA